MSEQNGVSRREILRHALTVIAMGSAGGAILACGKKEPAELSCTDTVGLPPADLETRTNFAYVDKSTDATKNCSQCQLFKPAAPNQCGGCNVVKGPINPAGYCKSFVAKPA